MFNNQKRRRCRRRFTSFLHTPPAHLIRHFWTLRAKKRYITKKFSIFRSIPFNLTFPVPHSPRKIFRLIFDNKEEQTFSSFSLFTDFLSPILTLRAVGMDWAPSSVYNSLSFIVLLATFFFLSEGRRCSIHPPSISFLPNCVCSTVVVGWSLDDVPFIAFSLHKLFVYQRRHSSRMRWWTQHTVECGRGERGHCRARISRTILPHEHSHLVFFFISCSAKMFAIVVRSFNLVLWLWSSLSSTFVVSRGQLLCCCESTVGNEKFLSNAKQFGTVTNFDC